MRALRLLTFVALLSWDLSRSVYRLMRRGFVPVVLISIPTDYRQPGPYILGLHDMTPKEVGDIVLAAAECVSGGRPSVFEVDGP